MGCSPTSIPTDINDTGVNLIKVTSMTIMAAEWFPIGLHA